MDLRAPVSVLLAAAILTGCNRQPAQTSGEVTAEPEDATVVGRVTVHGEPKVAPLQPGKPLPAGPPEIWKEFSGAKALEEVRRQVAVGPRHSGSEKIEKARALIEGSLRRAGWDVERQTFTDQTPRGPIQFVNLIGRFPAYGVRPAPRDTQRALVCSHYDTKRFSTIQFVGASDGGSSTGALLELARVLALDPALAMKVELVFFDGEEALVQFNATDGLYGSRHYAKDLRESGRAAQFRFGILWDMIGDKDFNLTLPPDSPKALTREIFAAAEALGARDKLGFHNLDIYDDHVPLTTVARIPTIDLIDFDYPPWHTADDTLDRLGPDGLQITGAITLYHLRRALK